MSNNEQKPLAQRTLTVAEFSRLSSSMQLTILAIRRAQVSSRRALAAMAERKKAEPGT